MTNSNTTTFSVGLEQGADGAVLAHALSVPGCVASGVDVDAALHAFGGELGEWLSALERMGEPVPPRDAELEISVDEWLLTDAAVAAGESTALFEADRGPLSDAEIARGLRRLGDLRGALLARVREVPRDELEHARSGGYTLREVLDELARAQWWTLSRLGASPLAEVPDRVLGRLDTAMALVVQHLGGLPLDRRDHRIEIEGEEWTPRKVLRRLLSLEWSLGRTARELLDRVGSTA